MKKTLLMLVLAACIAANASAQDNERSKGALTNKNGLNILPVAGDFALGIEASPFFQYLGNAFNTSDNSAPSFQGVDQTLYGKYFLRNNRALRAKLYLYIGSIEYKATVKDDAAVASNPLSEATVVDTRKDHTTNVQLSLGYEFRRGYGRLQGFYGGELGLGVNSNKVSYDHGNLMTPNNQTPTSAFAGIYDGKRLLENKMGTFFNIGLNAFVGVEYFFARKTSLGGELGLGFYHNSRPLGEATYEKYNASTNWVETISKPEGYNHVGSTSFSTATSGNIFLMFHF